jgi:outer membrane protein W
MKKIIFLIVTLASMQSHAQDNTFYVALGASSPVGDFHNAGGAKTGVTFDLGFTHKLKGKKTAFAAQLRGQSYPFNEQTTTANVTTWSASSILVGAMWVLPLTDKIFFQPKIMVGYTIASSPSVTYSGSTPLSIPSSSGSAFSDVFSATLRYDVWKKMSLLVSVDYFESDPKFNITASSSTSSQTYSTDQKMNSINFCAGLGYRF